MNIKNCGVLFAHAGAYCLTARVNVTSRPRKRIIQPALLGVRAEFVCFIRAHLLADVGQARLHAHSNPNRDAFRHRQRRQQPAPFTALKAGLWRKRSQEVSVICIRKAGFRNATCKLNRVALSKMRIRQVAERLQCLARLRALRLNKQSIAGLRAQHGQLIDAARRCSSPCWFTVRPQPAHGDGSVETRGGLHKTSRWSGVQTMRVLEGDHYLTVWCDRIVIRERH